MNNTTDRRGRWPGTPRTRVLAALAAVGLVTAACGGSNGPVSTRGGPAPSSSNSQTLVIARNMDLTSTDPSNAICDTCQFVFSATYETLVGLSNDNKTLTPRLAQSWSASAHDTAWTFKLNPAAKFEFPNAVTASYTGIINEKVAKAQGASDATNAAKTDKADKWFQSHSAGSGPYELQSFTSGSQVTMVANPNYWGTPAPITRIVVKQG